MPDERALTPETVRDFIRRELQRSRLRQKSEEAMAIEEAMANGIASAWEADRRERDLAIAHDRQPYPTASAYELVCAALTKAKARIEALEKRLARHECVECGRETSHTAGCAALRGEEEGKWSDMQYAHQVDGQQAHIEALERATRRWTLVPSNDGPPECHDAAGRVSDFGKGYDAGYARRVTENEAALRDE